jgi:hypothetical protein
VIVLRTLIAKNESDSLYPENFVGLGGRRFRRFGFTLLLTLLKKKKGCILSIVLAENPATSVAIVR